MVRTESVSSLEESSQESLGLAVDTLRDRVPLGDHVGMYFPLSETELFWGGGLWMICSAARKGTALDALTGMCHESDEECFAW